MGDFRGDFLRFTEQTFSTLKKWTTEEIYEQVKLVIDNLILRDRGDLGEVSSQGNCC